LDNQAVIKRTLNPLSPSLSSQAITDEVRALLETWEREHQGKRAALKWVPGHAGVAGNEEADRLAGAAARLFPPFNCTVTVAAGSRWARRMVEKDFKQWWGAQKQNPEKMGLPEPSTGSLTKMSRLCWGRLLAARSHHGDFEKYHKAWGHPEAERRCQCGARKTPIHTFTCQRLPGAHSLRYYRGRPMDLESLITTKEGEECIKVWEDKYFKN